MRFIYINRKWLRGRMGKTRLLNNANDRTWGIGKRNRRQSASSLLAGKAEENWLYAWKKGKE
ncbi:hypothetical protein EFB08_17070 [Rufibacter latericius]|uniref:Uncharacterized protein n=1 Tax=Rufibacter latericius TaxID=2487040 RepID=A0A3M9MFW9_9BACT|nr:hypothetical protein EFB08_17070 [Rufibacter latericius]